MNSDPYSVPQSSEPAKDATPEEIANCPNCGPAQYRKVSFTWWGGAIGPALFSHVKCKQCNAGYNRKTGKSNTTAIVIYSVVLALIGLALAIGFRVAQR